jgi:hypothetical protein
MTSTSTANGQPPAAQPGGAPVSGRVYWYDDGRGRVSSRGAPYAVVKAIPRFGARAEIDRCDARGQFSFPGLPPGEWSFVALHEDAQRVEQKPVIHQVAGPTDDVALTLYHHAAIDNERGKLYAWRLTLGLGVAIGLYLLIHLLAPAQVRPASLTLAALVAQAGDQIRGAETLGSDAGLAETLSEMQRLGAGLRGPDGAPLSLDEQQEIAGLVDQIEGAAAREDRVSAQLRLLRFDYLLRTLSPPTLFWNAEPWRYVEVVFWAVAGVMASQLVATTTYIRRGSYFINAEQQSVAQLVVTPLVVMVVVLLLSQAAFEITLAGGSAVRISLDNAMMLVGVSFALGLSFWLTWNWLRRFSGQVFGGEPGA